MKITLDWLKGKNACSEGISWFKNQKESEGIDVIKSLMKDKKYQWVNWTIVRLMVHSDQIKYAIYAAENVLDIYEKKYPAKHRGSQH